MDLHEFDLLNPLVKNKEFFHDDIYFLKCTTLF